jgi:hypothetical protein
MSGGKTPLRTPDMEKAGLPDYFPRPMTEDERRRKEWEKEKKRRKKAKAARKKKEVFVSVRYSCVMALTSRSFSMWRLSCNDSSS